MNKLTRKLSAIASAFAIVCSMISSSGALSVSAASYSEQVVGITKNGQVVDTFQGIDAEYVTYSSNTGYYSCAGYVSRFYADLFGVSVYNINMTDDKPDVYVYGHTAELKAVSNPIPGDIMQNKSYSHVGIVKSVSGSEVTLIEQNYKWNHWQTGDLVTLINRKCTKTENYYYRLYVDGKMQTLDSAGPAITNAKASGISCEGFTVTADISAPLGVSSVKVGVYPKSKGASAVKWKNATVSGSSASLKVKVSDFGSLDDTYCAEIKVTDKAGDTVSKTISADVDTTPPKISNVKVSGITADGYTVTCTVTDAGGIDAVKFPTWTTKGAADDLDASWNVSGSANGKLSGSTASFYVKTSAHNNEAGEYNTYIYAYDKYGNVTTKGVTANILYAPKAKTNYTYAEDAVRVNWETVSGATGYKVFVFNESSGKWDVAGRLFSSTANNLRIAGLRSGTAYKYRVQAFSQSGSEFSYGVMSNIIYTATKPDKPAITKTNTASEGIRLYWNKVNCTGYKIQQYNEKTASWTTIKKVGQDVTNYRISNLNSKTEYKFRIQAYKSDNAGGYTYSALSAVTTESTK